MGTSCCYYYEFNPAISDRKALDIQVALENMVDIHTEVLPPPVPMTIPRSIRFCICTKPSCICPINYNELVHHILRTIEHRTYSIKGSEGYQYSSAKLAYLLHLAQQL
jgi:hypothetical protein